MEDKLAVLEDKLALGILAAVAFARPRTAPLAGSADCADATFVADVARFATADCFGLARRTSNPIPNAASGFATRVEVFLAMADPRAVSWPIREDSGLAVDVASLAFGRRDGTAAFTFRGIGSYSKWPCPDSALDWPLGQ